MQSWASNVCGIKACRYRTFIWATLSISSAIITKNQIKRAKSQHGCVEFPARSSLRRGYSTTVIALLVFGTFQIAFLALHAIFDFAPIVLLIEAVLAVLLTTICLALII
jgi:hypothetical protein